LQPHLELAKINKYEIPEYVREIYDKALKFSKELKKIMTEKSEF
jgi:hypothetical protein